MGKDARMLEVSAEYSSSWVGECDGEYVYEMERDPGACRDLTPGRAVHRRNARIGRVSDGRKRNRVGLAGGRKQLQRPFCVCPFGASDDSRIKLLGKYVHCGLLGPSARSFNFG